MTSIDELAPPSNTLKAADLDGSEVTLTIASYTVKEFDEVDKKTGDKYKVKKAILSFHETDKTFVANKTNRGSIAYAYGKEMDEWIDKPITLYPTMVQFGNEEVEAIRVRVTKPSAGKPKFLKAKGGHPFAPENDDTPSF
jgi:hypothetical protein